MHKDILEQLYKPFTLKSRPGQGGQSFQYIEIEDIVDRMNRVFGGNWTTEVVEEKIVEDQILIRVRVGVRDVLHEGEGANFYYQEGYASQLLARFNFGDKKGQPIDVGNSFKSAMSKAIKTAVSRWGVGLYLEKASDEELLPDFPDAGGPGSTPKPKVQNLVPEAPFSPPMDPVIIGGPKKTAPVASKPVLEAPPAFDFEVPFSDEVVVKTVPKNNIMTPPVSMGMREEEYATDIQKVAIETIMAVHNIKFADLAARSLGRTENIPVSSDGLTYSDAVCMIKVGNNLKN